MIKHIRPRTIQMVLINIDFRNICEQCVSFDDSEQTVDRHYSVSIRNGTLQYSDQLET